MVECKKFCQTDVPQAKAAPGSVAIRWPTQTRRPHWLRARAFSAAPDNACSLSLTRSSL